MQALEQASTAGEDALRQAQADAASLRASLDSQQHSRCGLALLLVPPGSKVVRAGLCKLENNN